MPEVNLKDLEKKALEKKEEEEAKTIISKRVGDKEVFKGPFLEGWYDNRDECLVKNQEAYRISENKKLGLNEFGQTPEQVSRAEKRRERLKVKEEILKQLAAIDNEISELERKETNQESREKKTKEKK